MHKGSPTYVLQILSVQLEADLVFVVLLLGLIWPKASLPTLCLAHCVRDSCNVRGPAKQSHHLNPKT